MNATVTYWQGTHDLHKKFTDMGLLKQFVLMLIDNEVAFQVEFEP